MTTPDTPTLVELANDLDGARYVSMNDGTGDYDLPAAAALEMRLAADRIEYLEARAEKLAGALTNCVGIQSNGGNGGPSFVKVSFSKPRDQEALYSLISDVLSENAGRG